MSFNFSNITNLIKWTKTSINSNSLEKMIVCRNFENKGVLSGCLTGWLDNTLSDYGKKQASYMCINFMSDIRSDITSFYTSDMIRAKESLEILNLYGNNKVNVNRSTLLRDINYGEYEGFYYDGLKKEVKETLSNYLYKFKDGESYLDTKYRSILFLLKYTINSTKSDYANRQISFILSHNIFLKSILKDFKSHLISGDCFGIIIDLNKIISEKSSIIQILNEYKNSIYLKDNIDIDTKMKYLNKFDEIIQGSIHIDIGFRIPDLEDNNVNTNQNNKNESDDQNNDILNNKFIGI